MIILFSCDLSRFEAEVPNYLTLAEAALITGDGEGANSHRITEGWVYADSQLIGAYHLPATLPVLGENEISLDIFAGIRENGIADAPRIYPFYSIFKYEWDTGLMPELTVEPVFHYLPTVDFVFIDDFEMHTLFIADIDGDPLTSITRVWDPDIGSMVGKAALSHSAPELDVATAFIYEQFPRDGRPVFVELEYKSDVSLFVGLRTVNPGVESVSKFKLALFPNEMWEKIYVNFTPELRNADFSGFQVELFARYQQGAGPEIQNLYIDNLKLVHQQQ